MPSTKDVVDAINDISGAHAGHRAAHAKGIVCTGTFTASPGAKEISRAAHLQGDPVRTTVRLSNGGGDPTRPDAANDGRGLSVKFYLPDGSRTDIVAITLPVFFVRNPEDFLAFTRARKPDPETGQPDLDKVGAFLAEHPEAVPAIQFQLGMAAPASPRSASLRPTAGGAPGATDSSPRRETPGSSPTRPRRSPPTTSRTSCAS